MNTQKKSLSLTPNTSEINNQDWHNLVATSIVTVDEISSYLPVASETIEKVVKRYPMRITPYFLSLINKKGDPIWKQVVPDNAELNDRDGMTDPLSEESQSPVPHLVHRYPDRVLFLVSNQCAVYCRHCMRKRMVGQPSAITRDILDQGLAYIQKNKKIREVILSGGDPFLLEDNKIEIILKALRAIPHVDVIRIHTRVPGALPQRITTSLITLIKKFHPLFINTHFNHPDEITHESAAACGLLADAGIPLGCQTVLLKGVNDDAGVLRLLMQQLLKIRVRPYYLHHPDPVRGTSHFRVPVAKGLEIMKQLRGHSSGLCIPQYMIDLPGGGGKIPMLPEYVKETGKDTLLVQNYAGEIFEYPTS